MSLHVTLTKFNLNIKLLIIWKTHFQQDMTAINDPLGQTHSSSSSDHIESLNVVLFCEIMKSGDVHADWQTKSANIVITTFRDCGSASWINI